MHTLKKKNLKPISSHFKNQEKKSKRNPKQTEENNQDKISNQWNGKIKIGEINEVNKIAGYLKISNSTNL